MQATMKGNESRLKKKCKDGMTRALQTNQMQETFELHTAAC